MPRCRRVRPAARASLRARGRDELAARGGRVRARALRARRALSRGVAREDYERPKPAPDPFLAAAARAEGRPDGSGRRRGRVEGPRRRARGEDPLCRRAERLHAKRRPFRGEPRGSSHSPISKPCSIAPSEPADAASHRHLQRLSRLPAPAACRGAVRAPRRGLAAEAPDVVLLQEISVSEALRPFAEATGRGAPRAAGLDYEMVYAPANGSVGDGGNFEEGGAILARHPIAAFRRASARRRIARCGRELPRLPVRRAAAIALRGTIRRAGRRLLDVFGAHLTDAAPTDGRVPRREQVEDFATFVADRPAAGRPAIVAGDFNAAPDADEIGWLASRGFRDLCAANGAKADERSQRPRSRSPGRHERPADRLRVRAHARGRRVRVVDARLFLAAAVAAGRGGWLWASDHNGVVVDLEIK